MRLIDADELTNKYGNWYVEEGPEDGFIGDLKHLIDLQPTIAPSEQPEQDREFIRLTVRDSNGRPYYSIIYLEVDANGVGHDVEGYSSYSLDVISDYLKKYFMPSAQPDITKCGECRHAKERGCALFCEFWGKYTPHSGYCFKAERRKG